MSAAFDEMKGHNGGVRPAYDELSRWLERSAEEPVKFSKAPTDPGPA